MFADRRYQPSPRCPRCNNSTRLARSFPSLGEFAELHDFECDLCGLVVMKVVEAEIFDFAAPAVSA
jgi:hypothetical protein